MNFFSLEHIFIHANKFPFFQILSIFWEKGFNNFPEKKCSDEQILCYHISLTSESESTKNTIEIVQVSFTSPSTSQLSPTPETL